MKLDNFITLTVMVAVLASCASAAPNATATATPKARTFTVHTRNTERTALDMSKSGPSSGDLVVVKGALLAAPDAKSAPIGTFDLSAIVVTVAPPRERRQVFIELSFSKGAAERVLPGASKMAALAAAASPDFAKISAGRNDDLALAGVETYPAGGGILDTPLVLSVVGGTGAFIGARGQAVINYAPASQTFSYAVTLLD